jgi:UPF0755 protein
VSDGSERTPEDREAARLERERQRAERAQVGAATDEPDEAEHGDDDEPDRPQDAVDESFDEEDGGSDDDDYEDDSGYEDNHGYKHDDEAPAGTRRVSRLDRLRAARGEPVPEPAAPALAAASAPAPTSEPPNASPKPRPARKPIPAGARRGRDRAPRSHSLAGRIGAGIALVLAVAGAWFLVELFQPFHGAGHGEVTVHIPPHSSASQVGDLLEHAGVISSSFFFELRATLEGDRGDLRSGTYRLQQGMSYGAALKILTTPPPAAQTTDITIIDGHTRLQIDAILRSQGIRGYFNATHHSPVLDPSHYGAPRNTNSLEGFLFPDTYQVVEPVKVNALVSDQLKTFKQQFATVNLSYAERHHMTPYEVLIVASLVEGEGATPHDRALVASVVYNRLAAGMPLQSDATTRYATNNWTRPITESELHSTSPYNTYTHKGLPPTPINNPGLVSIDAAAHPAQTNYLYYVTKSCSSNALVFSANYQDFLRDVQRYEASQKRGSNSASGC